MTINLHLRIKVMIIYMAREPEKKNPGTYLYKVRFPPKTERIE